MTDDSMHFDRRTVIKTTGLAVAGGLAATGAASAGTDTIDDGLDTSSDELQEALVVFESNDDVDALADFDLADGYHGFEVLPIGYTRLTGSQIESVAALDSVRKVEPNAELEFHNDDAAERTGAKAVNETMFYTGETVHAAVIDSGVDGDHPDHAANLQHNYKYVNPLDRETMWVDARSADTDDNGHGTHVSGSVAGDGTQSDGEFEGMAPDADLTVYSTGLTLAVVNSIGAYDHLIDQKRKGTTDVQVVNNSYGPTSGNDADFDPNAALNVATYHAFEEGIVSMFSAGNSGPGTNTLSAYAKSPFVVGVAATNDETAVTGFSSRGRTPNYDGVTNYDRGTAAENLREFYETGSASGPLGIYRPGVGATGESIVSTMAPTDPLQGADNGTNESLSNPYYAAISGTSMSSPVTTGVVALVIDAYQQHNAGTPDPMDVITLLEATARDARDDHNVYNMGAGFIDAAAAVERAEAGDFPTRDAVDLADEGASPDFVFTPTGSRSDDGSVFTGGQTNQVDVTLATSEVEATVRDRIPFGWELVGGDAATTYTEDGERYVEFDDALTGGETATYFLEAPSGLLESDTYEFGPAQATPVDGDGVFVDITDTETNTVEGQST